MTTLSDARALRTRTLAGMGLMALAALAASGMNAIIRHLAGELHPFEIAFFRSAFGFAVLLPVLVHRGLAPLRTRRLGLHALRSILTAATMLAYFLALKYAPLAKVAALYFSAPLFASVMAALLLGERIRSRRIFGIALGFVGMLMVVRPGVVAIDLGTALTLMAAVTWAGGLVCTKAMSRTESGITTTLYMGLMVTPLALIAALPYWRTPTLEELAWLALIGGLGSLVHVSLTRAFFLADAMAVLPVDFTKMLWAAAFGFALFGEIPDGWTWAGAVTIFGAVLYVAYRESRSRASPPS